MHSPSFSASRQVSRRHHLPPDSADAPHIPMCSCSSMPRASYHSWSSGLPVRRSKLHVRPSPLPVRRHDTSLLDLHLTFDHCPSSAPAHQHSQETCCPLIDHSSLRKGTTRAHINLVFSISPLMSASSTHSNRNQNKRKVELGRRRKTHSRCPKAR